MNRLKFRVWDTIAEIFYHPDFITLGWEERVVISAGKYYEKMVDYAIIQQFTGLLDKSGKEIYEGDLLRKYFIDAVGATHNNLPAFEVKWNQQHCGFGITQGKHHYYEIIGNIFQNPELLK